MSSVHPTVVRAISSLLFISTLMNGQGDERRIVPFAGRRFALVIGNKAYPWKPLVNPINDAKAVASALADVGFAARDIHLVLDAHAGELRRSVREFVESVKPGDLTFVYYSGHGVEVKGINYLLPVDLPSDATEGYVQDEAVGAQRLMRDLTDQGAKARVLILDACRDNPLRAAKSTAGGLAPMEGKGSLIVFATEAGRTASDSPGSANAVFTKYLVEGLKMPGISLDDAMKRVSRNVARATGERQVPALYGLLLEDLVLLRSSISTSTPAAPVTVSVPEIFKGSKTNPVDGLTYVWIRPGSFQLGCSPGDNECYGDEKPPKQATIPKGFWMGESEVTQAAYRKVTGKTPSNFKGDDLPVEQVNKDEARSYCRVIGGRLPTEAEWEYAARAGTTGARYGELDRIAWHGSNSGSSTNPVKQKDPNAWGLYDMLGNVWEWVDGEKSLRGGSWDGDPRITRVSYRVNYEPSFRDYDDGFRCVWE